jgi:ABC-2 type transport system ATP-binding protein
MMNELIIETDGLVKEFSGGIRALDGLSLAVPRGIVYGLLGPNGAGKTTLIRILATLMRADAGTARVAGIDVGRGPAAVRARIGLAGQFAAVDDHLTGRENIHMVGRLYGLSHRDARQRTADVLERIGLADAADRPVKTYSGGMRRRVDLAASLIGRPDVLFLDEPTTGVDPASRRDLWALVGGLTDAGTTVLLTTQYLEEADRLAARVAVIDHGRLVSEGTPEQLKNAVGGTVLELTVPGRLRHRAVTALAAGGITATHHPARGAIVMRATRGADMLREALDRLDAAGVTPEDVSLRKPSLDDVFLHLTSHAPSAGELIRIGASLS